MWCTGGKRGAWRPRGVKRVSWSPVTRKGLRTVRRRVTFGNLSDRGLVTRGSSDVPNQEETDDLQLGELRDKINI